MYCYFLHLKRVNITIKAKRIFQRVIDKLEINSFFLLFRIIEVKMILNWLLCNIWISAIAFVVSKYPESGRASIAKSMLGKSHTFKF